jgi:hypothetical protein
MKIFEIILKILFFVGSIWAIKAETVSHPFLISYLILCLVLGIVLFFNKKQSYGYELSKREVVMRKIEGIILVAFSIFTFLVQGL